MCIYSGAWRSDFFFKTQGIVGRSMNVRLIWSLTISMFWFTYGKNVRKTMKKKWLITINALLDCASPRTPVYSFPCETCYLTFWNIITVDCIAQQSYFFPFCIALKSSIFTRKKLSLASFFLLTFNTFKNISRVLLLYFYVPYISLKYLLYL